MSTVVRASKDNLYIFGYSLEGLFTYWKRVMWGGGTIPATHVWALLTNTRSHTTVSYKRLRLNSSSFLIFQHV